MNKISKILTAAMITAPILALAQFPGGPGGLGPAERAPVQSFEDVIRIINTAIGWFQAVLFILAVIFILFAAFNYITSGGDPGKVEKARMLLIYAAVGIGVALLAYAVEPVVRQLLGSPPPRF